MRILFGVLSLLVVVAIVGVLAKKQLSPAAAPSSAAEPGAVAPLTGTPRQQVDQFQKAVQGAMDQQPRQMPDDSTK
jgi:hypothetical protein